MAKYIWDFQLEKGKLTSMNLRKILHGACCRWCFEERSVESAIYYVGRLSLIVASSLDQLKRKFPSLTTIQFFESPVDHHGKEYYVINREVTLSAPRSSLLNHSGIVDYVWLNNICQRQIVDQLIQPDPHLHLITYSSFDIVAPYIIRHVLYNQIGICFMVYQEDHDTNIQKRIYQLEAQSLYVLHIHTSRDIDDLAKLFWIWENLKLGRCHNPDPPYDVRLIDPPQAWIFLKEWPLNFAQLTPKMYRWWYVVSDDQPPVECEIRLIEDLKSSRLKRSRLGPIVYYDYTNQPNIFLTHSPDFSPEFSWITQPII